MACSSRAVRLRDSISNWDQDLKGIQEPNAAFHEELTILRDRSRRRLEQFALDPSQDDISLVQLALLSDGRHIKELELNHAATRAQKQEAYDYGTEVLARKIIGDLVNIFGLPTMQRLATELFSPIGDQGHIARLSGHFNELSSPDQPDAAAEELVLQPNGYHTRRAGRLRPMILPSPHSSVAKSGVRRCLAVVKLEPEPEVTRPAFPTSTEPSLAITESLYQHDEKQKAVIRKRGRTLTKKSVEFGVDGHTACVLVYRNPIHHTWVCAMHIPEGQDVPSLDAIVRFSPCRLSTSSNS
ncbi:hypothetical protein BGZ61DRAFT_557522 [Ilyonectria robusta]|uniref:uncharacterized protein n=1 Tax=Ilyonectria robusta TaxID=1079257 RepID=UPI001E8D53A8|nr:uncharacterized protein BGZ61DRAFT_557522 [Ilyonectria robusta]KAH8669222.1 hypothetical protein BGZ61DRAFT_557522 [Ilyonectria robusta]